MIHINERDLPGHLALELSRLQSLVNEQNSFEERAGFAKSLWKSKGGVVGERAFEEIRTMLEDMSIGKGICNYCEQNEASDIEHVLPKTFYPDFAFIWENYLLACKTCNTGYKLAKAFVVDPNGEIRKITGNPEVHGTSQAGMINPRTEFPERLMIVNLETWTFDHQEDLSAIEKAKVNCTWEILQLNRRDVLQAARESAAKHCYDAIKEIVRIMEAKTKEEIQRELGSPLVGRFDFSQSLDALKSEIIDFRKGYFKHELPSPSVWLAIKQVASRTDEHWQELFGKLPEALDW